MTAEFTVAVHAVVYLNHKKDFCSSEDIAKNICTNPARVRKVLSRLKHFDIIEAKTSVKGGYAFTKNPKQISLYDIFCALEEKVISLSWRTGDENACCEISRGMQDAMDTVFEEVDMNVKQTLKKTTIYDMDNKIFDNI